MMPAMFDHVLLRVSDFSAARAFYDTVLTPLEAELAGASPRFARWQNLAIIQAGDERSVTRGAHVGLVAPSREAVDAFWAAGTQAGYRDDGAPGPRPEYAEDYYGAFLLDPDGNSIEALHRGRLAGEGLIDHLWIRVGDVPAARDFYATVAPHTGFTLADDLPARATFRGDHGSFSLVPGTPTENLHVAFLAPDEATVRAFHAEATAAGYPDNGGPGQRPQYSDDYYGAFVHDPDATNVEAVNYHG
jgi:catechol 2,3-dioxygenase-like lactoylglutathione lyase family enzyme